MDPSHTTSTKGRAVRRASTADTDNKKRDKALPPKLRKPVEVAAPQPNMLVGRVARIVRLMTVLQSREQLTVKTLSSRLGVSRRTIFRDLKVLEKAGVPFISSPQGYRLDPDYRMVQINLGVPEALGLMVLCKVAQSIPHQPLFGAAIDAVTKCIMQLPAESREVYRDLVENVSYSPGFINISEEDEKHFRQLQYAIDERLVCKLKYHPVGEGERVRTDISPVHLHFYKHSWYVLAHSEQHGEVRMFKLARIEALEPTKRHFDPIPFSIDEHLDDAWGVIPGTQKHDVVIEFSPKVARNAAEIRWHHSQESEFRADGSCIMRFHVNGLDEMKWWVFSYADQAIVREPEELRDMICEMAQHVLAVNKDRNGETPKR